MDLGPKPLDRTVSVVEEMEFRSVRGGHEVMGRYAIPS